MYTYLLILTLIYNACSLSEKEIPYIKSCSGTKYYNPTTLKCDETPQGFVEQGGSFVCNFLSKVSYDGLESVCETCADGNQVTSLFQEACVVCTKESGSTHCECDYTQNNILIDTPLTGATPATAICTPCQQGYRPGDIDHNNIPRRCVRCRTNNCECKLNAGFCFTESELGLKVKTTLTYDSLNDGLHSALFENNLIGSYLLCNSSRETKTNNLTACQLLTNLCSLTMNNKDSFLNSLTNVKDACQLLLTVTQDQSKVSPTLLYHRPGWLDRVPWNFYQYTFVGSVVFPDNNKVLTEDVNQKYTFDKSLNTSYLQIEVAQYSLYGDYLGLTPLTSQLSQCDNPVWKFGTTHSISCSVRTSTIMSTVPMFYELFLRSGDALRPIPTLITNTNKATVTALSRRFFLMDGVSGIKDDTQHVVRYCSQLQLTVQMREDPNGDGYIYIPLLKVTYDDIGVLNNPVDSVIMKLDVIYSSKDIDLEKNLGIAIGAVSFLALIYATIKTVGWRRRNNVMMDCTCQSIGQFVVFLAIGLGTMFFWILVGTSWYFLFIYKGQSTVSMFLPTDLSPYTSLLISTFILTLVSRLHLLYRSTSYDVFFIDWERPKGTSIPSTKTDKEILTSVSIWRTYFLANEWNELHTSRKINPTLQYVLFIFLTDYIGLKYLTTNQPEAYIEPSDVQYISAYNTLLRCGLVFSLFFVMWFIQRLYTFLYERFISNQIQLYIDLCSLSNISIVILSDSVYGYYIHGRSVHGHADTDMQDMVGALKREEDNLCSKRGLLPNSEQQTFDMLIPPLMRQHFDRILQPLTTRDISQRPGQDTNLNKQMLAYSNLNKFFGSFIEHSLDNIDYTVSDKLFLESFFDVEFYDNPDKGKGTLYNDSGQSFENVLYYGNEWALFKWELLLLLILDLITSDFIFSAALTWFINEVLFNKLSSWQCQRNLASKALIDERFLI